MTLPSEKLPKGSADKSGGRWMYSDANVDGQRRKAGLADPGSGKSPVEEKAKHAESSGEATPELVVESTEAAREPLPPETSKAVEKAEPLAGFLHEIAACLKPPYTPGDMALEVIRILEESAGYDYAAILILDSETGLLRPLALSPRRYSTDYDKAVEEFASTHYLGVSEGVIGWVADTGKPVCLGDVRGHHLFSSIQEEVRSILCVPIFMGKMPIGAILLESAELDAYSKVDLKIMETVSKQLAIAIENAYLKDQVKSPGNGFPNEADSSLLTVEDPSREILEDSDALLRQLVASGPAILYQAEDTELRGMLFVTPQIEELLGISPEQWTSSEEAWLESLHEDDRERIIAALARSRQYERRELTLEYRLIDSDDEVRWFRDSSKLVDNPAGIGQMWQGVLLEITMRREMEEEIEEEIDKLTELNAALVYQNEELNAFSHTVAHDLQNPLSILVGFAEMLEREYTGVEDELLNQGVQVIADNGRRLQNIIKELLLLAEVRQIDELDQHPLEMVTILEEVRKRLINMVEQYEATVIVPPKWPKAQGYGPWVEEIWVNYISNAIKYGGDPPRVEVGATLLKDGQIKFWVQDNGRGISRKEQSQLFRPFARLPHARAQGYGLGLSIVQRIVAKLGGQVGLDSKNGRGSRFWFTLPAAEKKNS